MAERRFDAVFFDHGGTLGWVEPSADEIWVRVLAEHGYRITSEDVVRRTRVPGPEINRSDLHRAVEDLGGLVRDSFPATAAEQRAFYRRADGAVLERLGIPVRPEILDTAERRFARDLRVHKFDDVDGTLGRLADDGYRLGVISNADHKLPHRIAQLDLSGYFDGIAYSWEVGAEKPDPRIFRTALQRLRVDANRAVHVGDSYEADVVGARGAGMTPMLVDREGASRAADCIVLGNLFEVTEHL
jgi:HAD superfamily hydrolase (TIGR01549 family)